MLHSQPNTPPPAPAQVPSPQPSVPPPPAVAAPAPPTSPTVAAGTKASTRSAPPTPPSPPSPAPAHAADQPIIDFEFQGAPITAILDWYSRLTGRSIISAPNLNAQINFRSQSKLTKEEAIEALDSVLAINNIAAIPMGEKFLKIVQITTAKQEGLPVGRVVAPADTLGTQIIPLKNAKASDVVTVLQPYLHPYGQLMALQDSNSILISETAANLKQMMEIVTYVDQPSALRMEMRTYVLKHAKAADVMARLQSIIQEAEQAGAHAAAPGQPPSPIRRPGQPSQATEGGEESVVEGKVIMAADDRTNKLFILTRISNFGFFDRLITELDAKVEPDVVMKVILLNYAAAEDVAGLLNALISGGSAPSSSSTTRRTTSSTGTTGTGGTTSTGARAPSVPPPPMSGGGGGAGVLNTGFLQYAEGVHILPDPRTNCLLVMATKEDMARIQELVRSIDTSVAQVQIEVVIAELTLNNELDVGVDMFNRLSSADQGRAVGTGGNSTDGNVPVQLTPLSAIGSNLPTAAALASGAGGLTYFTTFKNLNLDTVLHALATTSNSKVLSTPVIQTMDNQEADIIVGESVPVPTSQTSSLIAGVGTSGQTLNGVTSSIQYEDVAIELDVTPRINPDGYVRMDINQKVNDLGANVNIGGTVVPTILKREAKSSLAVEDRSTIVLGGMIQQTKTVSTTKTPFLGDIPFFGQLFKSQTNNRQRTELIIFIRPVVLRSDLVAVAEAKRRLRMLGVSEELEETYFPRGSSGTNNAALPPKDFIGSMAPNQPNQAAPPPSSDSTNAPAPGQSSAAQPPTDYSSDRQSDKVKALKLQDGDITTQ
jgi:general secretion pathway protein D